MQSPDETFPVASCGPCGREVLTHLVLVPGDDPERRCLHCDAAIDPDELRWVFESELDPLGYGLASEGGGCGSGGCGTGGCSR